MSTPISRPFRPSVDIVIAARNEAKMLAQCLESLASQNYPRYLWRVVVVDNGSSDDTGKIAEQYGATVVRHEAPGAAAARNAGLAQGRSDLVAFLDAHCCVAPSWLRLLAERFDDPKVGGCQGETLSRSTNPRIQRYLEGSALHSGKRVAEDSVSGKRSLFPWLLSGNSMYRRRAIQEAGGFNETLPACEDVDLAWRVLLSGYQLSYEPEAFCVHYDCNSWTGFFRKSFRYGRGAAWLAKMYKEYGAGQKYRSSRVLTLSPQRSLSALYYDAGYRWQRLRIRLGLDHPAPLAAHTAGERLRSQFMWKEGLSLRISPQAVYWFTGDEAVVVHVSARRRLVLNGAATFIWRALANEHSREAIAVSMIEAYGIPAATAFADLDDFIAQAVENDVLIRRDAMAPDATHVRMRSA